MRVNPDDIKIEAFMGHGPGGQHRNRTYSAIRATHVPTGISAQCQSERSQHTNRERALKVLYARLAFAEAEERAIAKGERRKQPLERVRTYSFADNRVTDHRTGVSIRNVQRVLDGDLECLRAKD